MRYASSRFLLILVLLPGVVLGACGGGGAGGLAVQGAAGTAEPEVPAYTHWSLRALALDRRTVTDVWEGSAWQLTDEGEFRTLVLFREEGALLGDPIALRVAVDAGGSGQVLYGAIQLEAAATGAVHPVDVLEGTCWWSANRISIWGWARGLASQVGRTGHAWPFTLSARRGDPPEEEDGPARSGPSMGWSDNPYGGGSVPLGGGTIRPHGIR